MNATVAQLINEQINKEFYSAYLYLDFANYYAAAGLDGFENWYRVQAQEERDHALLFFQYLLNNGVAVSFGAVDAPDWARGGMRKTPDQLAAQPRHLAADCQKVAVERASGTL